MNVLILTSHLNPGGIPRYCLNLAKGLKDRGHTVLVSSSGGEWEEDLKLNQINHFKIPIRVKSFIHFKVFVSMLMLIPIIKASRIEVIHANTRVTQFLAMILSKICSIPYISAFHGFYKPSLTRKWFKFCGNLSIAVSKAVKEHLIKDLNIRERNCRIVYNGIDPDKFSPRIDTKIDSGFTPQDFVIGIMGRISQEKGQLLAIEAMRIVVKRYPQAKLLICGIGKMQEKAQQLIEKYNLTPQIQLLNLPADDFLNIIDLLIVPSRQEGFGLAIVEAFTKNVPVIGYNTGGIPEIIRDRINGLLFYSYNPRSLSDAINEMIANPQLRQQLACASQESLQFFSIPRMACDTETVYQDAIKKYH